MGVRNYLGAFGHVVLDYVVTVPRLPRPNTSIQILDRQRYFGGTAGNLARAAARLGVKVSLASFVGPDFPADYWSALKEEGVDLRDLRRIANHMTPTAWVFSDRKGDQMAIIDQGPMKDAARRPVLRHSVRDAELVHLGTGRPEYYAKVADYARELDRAVSFDPSQEIHYVYRPQLFRRLMSRADYFFGNEAEIAQAKRFMRVTSTGNLLPRANVVVATLGARGSVVFNQGHRIRIPRVRPRRVVDVTGAGDAYRAGFYAGLSRGYDLRRCGLLGSTVASFTVEEKGTQTNLPSWTQTLRRASRYGSL
jgi:sugar/nucleoside kinase (ribokinase family)